MTELVSYYTCKIHSNPEFYEAEKKGVVKYLVKRCILMKNTKMRRKNTAKSK